MLARGRSFEHGSSEASVLHIQTLFLPEGRFYILQGMLLLGLRLPLCDMCCCLISVFQ